MNGCLPMAENCVNRLISTVLPPPTQKADVGHRSVCGARRPGSMSCQHSGVHIGVVQQKAESRIQPGSVLGVRETHQCFDTARQIPNH